MCYLILFKQNVDHRSKITFFKYQIKSVLCIINHIIGIDVDE